MLRRCWYQLAVKFEAGLVACATSRLMCFRTPTSARNILYVQLCRLRPSAALRWASGCVPAVARTQDTSQTYVTHRVIQRTNIGMSTDQRIMYLIGRVLA